MESSAGEKEKRKLTFGPSRQTPCVDKWGRYLRRRRFSPIEHGSLTPYRALGWDRTIEMITFKMDFRPTGFDRPVTEHFKDQILLRLARAGIATLSVLIKQGPRRELVLHFDGIDEDVEKAKAAFDTTP